MHTATPCDLKSPIRYARRGCPRLNSHRGASAAAVIPGLHRDTTLPACSCAFTVGKFRWWYSNPPCNTFGGWRLFPNGFPLSPALECWYSSRGLLFAASRVFVSPVQPALLPGSQRTDGFHVLIFGLPQGREQGRMTRCANTPARQPTLIYPILRRKSETTRNCRI